MGTKVYFFMNEFLVQYDRGEDKVDDDYITPMRISDRWPSMSVEGFDIDLDTVVNWGNGNVYFFKEDKYILFDIATNSVMSGYPKLIAEYWTGMQEVGFDSNLDAAVNWGDGNVYFFKGDKYVRYNIEKDRVDDGYNPPLLIAEHWTGMQEVGFDSDIDAVINWGDGNVYFFKGDKYIRFNIAKDRVDDGYEEPLSIASQWPGMEEAGFSIGLNLSFDLLDLSREIWLPGAQKRPRSPVGPKNKPLMPWRGVLHTTEGDTISGAEATLDEKKVWSHLLIDPKTLQVIQYIPLNVGARALADANGTVPTNSAHCIQIEIVGRAENSPNLPPEHLAFIREVMRQIEEKVPIPRRSGLNFLDYNGASTTPSNRMSVEEWTVFSGWCGHQHVPANNHWDPGAIDIWSLLNS